MGAAASWAVPLGSAAIGGLLGGRGSRQGGTVTQTSDPWWAVQPHLQDLFSRGQGLLGQGQSPQSMQSIAERTRLASSPMGLVPGAQQELAKTIGGGYLDVTQNPALEAAATAARDRAISGVSGRFSGENYGASPSREWMTRAATEATAPFYFGEYGRERGRQFDALRMAPGLEAASYMPADQLQQAGQQVEDFPWSQLARYRGLLTGTPGGSTTTPYFENPWASMLGGGLLGAQLGSSIYRNWPSGGGGGTSPYEPNYGIPYGSPGSGYE